MGLIGTVELIFFISLSNLKMTVLIVGIAKARLKVSCRVIKRSLNSQFFVVYFFIRATFEFIFEKLLFIAIFVIGFARSQLGPYEVSGKFHNL